MSRPSTWPACAQAYPGGAACNLAAASLRLKGVRGRSGRGLQGVLGAAQKTCRLFSYFHCSGQAVKPISMMYFAMLYFSV